MREVQYDDDELTAANEAGLRLWARRKCKAWNWNADVAEIAKELIDEGIDPDSRAFRILCEEFDEFFQQPEMSAAEAIQQILETFS